MKSVVHLQFLRLSVIFNVMQGVICIFHIYINQHKRVWKEGIADCLVVFKEMIGRVFLTF